MTPFPPGFVLLLGAVLVPLVRGKLRAAVVLALPAAALALLVHLHGVPAGDHGRATTFGYDLVTLRVDRLSLVFGLVFGVAALLNGLYGLSVKDPVQHVAGLTYAGSAIGAVFAGDWITFFAFWELTAITSVFLIWAARTERSYRVGMRYLLVQVGSGVLLLAGILIHLRDGGGLALGPLPLDQPGPRLILLAIGIKAAFPALHAWLTDAYPESTPLGGTYLCVFTTKLAIYALARTFAGADLLVWIGTVMAVFPVFYALVADDLRRVLAYALVNPLGFMVVGVGLGTPLALDGVAALAVAHILYKDLLFMATGAVLERTGTAKASALGGLGRAMPWTMRFAVLGGLAMAAPLTCGFVSKALVLTAVAEAHRTATWVLLVLSAAGVFVAAALRLPWAAFFRGEPRDDVEEAPAGMRVAMGVAAALCVLVGVFPDLLYARLPHAPGYEPYDVTHVVTQLQLLAFAALAFALLLRAGVYPRPQPGALRDVDWLYRRALPALVAGVVRAGAAVRDGAAAAVRRVLGRGHEAVYRRLGPDSFLASTWSMGGTVLWIAVILSAFLLVYYFEL